VQQRAVRQLQQLRGRVRVRRRGRRRAAEGGQAAQRCGNVVAHHSAQLRRVRHARRVAAVLF
jgi:hypothetical protein